jgi:hypothetical protein
VVKENTEDLEGRAVEIDWLADVQQLEQHLCDVDTRNCGRILALLSIEISLDNSCEDKRSG